MRQGRWQRAAQKAVHEGASPEKPQPDTADETNRSGLQEEVRKAIRNGLRYTNAKAYAYAASDATAYPNTVADAAHSAEAYTYADAHPNANPYANANAYAYAN